MFSWLQATCSKMRDRRIFDIRPFDPRKMHLRSEVGFRMVSMRPSSLGTPMRIFGSQVVSFIYIYIYMAVGQNQWFHFRVVYFSGNCDGPMAKGGRFFWLGHPCSGWKNPRHLSHAQSVRQELAASTKARPWVPKHASLPPPQKKHPFWERHKSTHCVEVCLGVGGVFGQVLVCQNRI